MDKHRDVGRYPCLSVKITVTNQPKLAAVCNNSENYVIDRMLFKSRKFNFNMFLHEYFSSSNIKMWRGKPGGPDNLSSSYLSLLSCLTRETLPVAKLPPA
jgi:hypothetical protein